MEVTNVQYVFHDCPLQVLVEDDSQLQKQLKPSKRQRELELLARTYLHDVGKNVSQIKTGRVC